MTTHKDHNPDSGDTVVEAAPLLPRPELKRVLAQPPFLGDMISDDEEGFARGLLLVLTLTVKEEEAKEVLAERGEEAQTRRRTGARQLTEQYIREAIGRESGPLSQQDLASVTVLDLSDSDVTDLSPLAALTNLQKLHLSGTQVTDVSVLAALTKLQNLYLYDTQVRDVSPLAALANLLTLSLMNTRVTNLSPLAALTNLQNLYLDGTRVTDVSPLAALTNLLTLHLIDTQVKDVSPLTALTNLQNLDLENTQVTEGDAEALPASITKLVLPSGKRR